MKHSVEFILHHKPVTNLDIRYHFFNILLETLVVAMLDLFFHLITHIDKA
jgi:hypothetical protein